MDTFSTNTLPVLFHDITRFMRYRFDARAKGLGVTNAQCRVLLLVARQPGMSQTIIADWLGVERITAGRMIDRLVEADLLERRSDPSDRRVWNIHLQPAAERLVESLAEIVEELERETCAMIGDVEKEALTSVLTRMRDWLRPRDCDLDRREVA